MTEACSIEPELVQIAPKQHARLGASTASRWMACPGSVKLSEGLPPQPESIYAREGTSVHGMIEMSLSQNRQPLEFLDTVVEGVKVTEAMVDGADVFVNHVRPIMAVAKKIWIERPFSLAKLDPPEPMFGTSDFTAYLVEDGVRILDVSDYKNGSGVVVEIYGNKQTKYYALGALLELDPAEFPVDEVRITIVQPNAAHRDGPIRTMTLTYMELVGFANELLAAAHATHAPDAPLVAGSHCKFCPASGICPAQRAAAQEVAMVEFAAMPVDVPPAPSILPDEVFFDMLPKLDILQAWIKAMKDNAQARLLRGEHVPGFKLVAKRANRSWPDESQTVEYLKSVEGLDTDEIFNLKIKSPAQVEKVIGKGNIPETLVQKVSTGYNMVPDTDARPSVDLSAGAEFLLLPSGESDNE